MTNETKPVPYFHLGCMPRWMHTMYEKSNADKSEAAVIARLRKLGWIGRISAGVGERSWSDGSTSELVVVFRRGVCMAQLEAMKEVSDELGLPAPYVTTTHVLGIDEFPNMLAVLFDAGEEAAQYHVCRLDDHFRSEGF